jgi:chromosome segregation ATPase
MTEDNKTGKPDMGVVSWRIGAERKRELTERFGTPSGQAAIESVMDVYFNQFPTLQEEHESVKSQLSHLQAENERLQTELQTLQTDYDTRFDGEVAAATETINALKAEKEEFANKVDQLTLELNESARNQTSLTLQLEHLKEEMERAEADESIIRIKVSNEIVRKLLYALKQHLTERYEREVSFYEIFVLSTLLYNVEKRCKWFYPYLKDSEIEEISGKTIKEWKSFLKQKG